MRLPTSNGNCTSLASSPAALDLAELERRPPYALRHTYASFCLAAGCDLDWLARQMGHKSVRVTADTYAHLIPRRRDDALHRLDSWGALAYDEPASH
jgi:integrase